MVYFRQQVIVKNLVLEIQSIFDRLSIWPTTALPSDTNSTTLSVLTARIEEWFFDRDEYYMPDLWCNHFKSSLEILVAYIQYYWFKAVVDRLSPFFCASVAPFVLWREVKCSMCQSVIVALSSPPNAWLPPPPPTTTA
jgi:hypothetical protein